MKNVEEMIENCKLCGEKPKLSCNSIKLGNSKILILGESPAKDGWIQSGRAFYNKKGRLQATGKILAKLLSLCNLTLDEINFTECCKCIIDERKQIRKCMQNCKQILFAQIDQLDCELILPMGQYPTEIVLGQKINRLGDFVGKEFFVNFGSSLKKVVPIYHTSPANPLCYKGNEEIFKKLKNHNSFSCRN